MHYEIMQSTQYARKQKKVMITTKQQSKSVAIHSRNYLSDTFLPLPNMQKAESINGLKTALQPKIRVETILPVVEKVNRRLEKQDERSKLYPTPKSSRPVKVKLSQAMSKLTNLRNKSSRKKFFYNKSHIATLSIQSSRNNTLLTLSGHGGRLLKGGWVSAGSLGFKNSRKSTTYASQAAAKSLALRAKQLGVRALHLKLQGTGRAKGAVVRTLRKSSLRILVIRECTPTLHNGCRSPKKRRI